jgi:hypothetical protein
MSASRSYLRALAVQVIAKDDGSGEIIKCRFSLAWGSQSAAAPWQRVRFLQRLPGFPRGQPLIHHFDPNTERTFDPRGKSGCFLGHFAGCPVQVQRQAYDDPAYAVFFDQLAQAREIPPPVRAVPGREGLRGHAVRIGQGQPQPLPAIINGQDYARGGKGPTNAGRNGHKLL